MYNNAGWKIKKISYILCIVLIIAYVVFGIVLMAEESFGLGLLAMIAGGLLSWFVGLLLYGFGELIDLTDNIEYRLSNIEGRLVEGKDDHSDKPKPLYGKKKPGDWECPNCMKINASYVGTCSCGQQKPRG